MDLLPTAEQEQLQEVVRGFCDRHAPPTRTRNEPTGFSRTAWEGLAELGAFGLCAPESAGGVGLGTTDAVLVFTELGRALVPGPLIASHLAASVLPEAVTGELVCTLLEATGDPRLVEHLDHAGGVILLTDDAVSLARTPVAGAEPVKSLDPMTPLHRMTERPSGCRLGGRAMAWDWQLHGAVRTAAFQLGIAEATLELTVDHAREREQFGKPVGTFQAVKHLCADMLVRVETARAAVHVAAASLDEPGPGSPDKAVSVAKFLADRAAVNNSLSAIQLHGGMGFAWELNLHLYLKRARVHATRFGAADAHSERVAEKMGR